MGDNQGRRVCFVQFARWLHRGRSLPSPTASCYVITSLLVGKQSIVINVSVCLSVCLLTYLKNHTSSKFHQILSTCYLSVTVARSSWQQYSALYTWSSEIVVFLKPTHSYADVAFLACTEMSQLWQLRHSTGLRVQACRVLDAHEPSRATSPCSIV